MAKFNPWRWGIYKLRLISRFVSQHTRLSAIRSFLVHYVGGLIDKMESHHAFLMASGLAFSLFVCIVPMVLLVFAVLGQVLSQPSIAESIDSTINRFIPYPEFAEYVKEMVLSRVEEFSSYKNAAGIIGLIGIFFASTGLFSSIRTILNTIFEVRTTGPFFLGKLRDFGLTIAVLIYFLLSTTVLPGIGIIGTIANRIPGLSGIDTSSIEGVAFPIVSLGVMFLAYLIIYFAVPEKKPPRRVIYTGAISASILWVAAKELFGLYIAHAATLKQIYGVYALLIFTAFWIYYTSLTLVIGAEIGQLAGERKKEYLSGPMA